MSAVHAAAAVAAIVLAGGAIWLRRKRRLGGDRLVLALLGAVALGVYASGVLSNLPDAKKVIEDLADALGPGTYALVGVMAFLETGAFVGLVAPGEFTVIIGGVIAGQGEISIIPLIGLTWACCIAGDTVSFFVGRRLGRSFLERHGPKVKITHERLEHVDGYFQRHGGKTILIGRFIGLVRAVAPFIAGSSGMQYRRFIPYSVIGTGLWATAYLMLGYVFYRSFDRVAAIAGRATLVFAALVALIIGIRFAYVRLRDEEQRARFLAWVDRQSRRPLLRPVAAVARALWRVVLGPAWRVVWPQVRFVWERITPGELGLELTTAIATAGVGLYIFVGNLVMVSDDPTGSPLDKRVYDIARDLRLDIGVDAAKVFSVVGSLPVVAGLVVVSALVLAFRRRPIELVVLVVSMLAIHIAVHVTKGAVDRPRPPQPLVGSAGSAYPSGHAAYSTAYVAMTVIASRVMGGVFSKATAVLVSVALAAAIGGSRIVLQVHWLSDVAGGWGLGAAIFGIVGTLGLVVGYLRNNEVAPAAPAGPSQRSAPERVPPVRS
jgi:membrane protein DedA with SNARE-associated domain/membrane-associated phospholipid phosphatase